MKWGKKKNYMTPVGFAKNPQDYVNFTIPIEAIPDIARMGVGAIIVESHGVDNHAIRAKRALLIAAVQDFCGTFGMFPSYNGTQRDLIPKMELLSSELSQLLQAHKEKETATHLEKERFRITTGLAILGFILPSGAISSFATWYYLEVYKKNHLEKPKDLTTELKPAVQPTILPAVKDEPKKTN